MDGSRTRRAGALGVVALAAILACLPAFPGNSARLSPGRPLALLGGPAQLPIRHLQPIPRTLPAWEALAPAPPLAQVPLGRSTVTVPILMYHYVRTPPNPAYDRLGWGLSTSPADFAAQMDWLDRNGYHPVTLTDLRDYLAERRVLPDRPVVLTFDDGYEDFYTTAFPILQAHHFRAVSYVVSGFIGRSRYLTAQQIRTLDANGVEIGAHTVDHVDLTRSTPGGLAFQVAGSKATLETLLGHPVLDFCYPSGKFDDRVVAEVEAAGFESATTTQPGSLHSAADRFSWSRVRVSGGESLATFIEGVSSFEAGVPVSVPPIQLPRVYPLLYLGPGPGLE